MDIRRDGVIIEKKKMVLKNKLVIVGFPGMALVGKGVADFIIGYLGLEPEVTIHPLSSPSNVVVDGGIMALPTINIYTKRDVGIAVVTSSFQPQSDEGQNAIAHILAEYFASKKVLGVISAAAYVTPNPSKPRRVYVASTSKEFLKRLADMGLIPMTGGISGLNGLIPGIAQLYGVPGATLLGETGEIYMAGNIVDYLAIASVIEIINKIAGLELPVDDLYRKGLEIEEKIAASTVKEEEEKPSPTYL